MRGRERVLVAAVVLVVMLLPLLSLLPAGAGACLADPLGEIQVKLWVYDAFLQPGRLFGGDIDEIRHPTPGLLNNPDLVGTLVIGGLNGLLGDCAAYNLLVSLQLGANALAAWWLGRQWGGDDLAGLGVVLDALQHLLGAAPAGGGSGQVENLVGRLGARGAGKLLLDPGAQARGLGDGDGATGRRGGDTYGVHRSCSSRSVG